MSPDTVYTTLQYSQLPLDGSKPCMYIDHDLAVANGKPRTNFESDSREMEVENVRGQEHAFSTDNSGFQFIKHTSAHLKFTDNEEIKREYYPESIELLKKVTGANRVILFDHTIRRHRPGQEDNSEDTRQPVRRVHVDQTPESATRRVHMHAPSEIAPELLKHRFQIINLWRPITHPATDFPLALCDFRSINWETDLVRTTLKFRDRDGETFSVKYNPAHKWKYLRGMTLDEAVLIKCFDSKTDGSVAILTPHTGFIDPTTPKDAPLRESIELRALVFYDDLPVDA
ncbi:hypothetical protein BU17DRAFT_90435 [Hysterangium stoloniferum]|nr:hypothetical protein BU17DRAFT_90435 [Hysterangium stoloniferum]